MSATPPTDRPLTAGYVPLLREGDIIRGPNGKTYRFEEWGDGGFLTFIDEPHDGFLATLCTFVSRPATSAASEGEGPVAWKYELASSICSDGTYTNWQPAVVRLEPPHVPEGSIRNLTPLYAALASPLVSERERELEELLAMLEDYADRYIGATRGEEMSLEEMLISKSRDLISALTSQPAGEGK